MSNVDAMSSRAAPELLARAGRVSLCLRSLCQPSRGGAGTPCTLKRAGTARSTSEQRDEGVASTLRLARLGLAVYVGMERWKDGMLEWVGW